MLTLNKLVTSNGPQRYTNEDGSVNTSKLNSSSPGANPPNKAKGGMAAKLETHLLALTLVAADESHHYSSVTVLLVKLRDEQVDNL